MGVSVTVSAAGWVIFTVAAAVQPVVEVAVTVYEPALMPARFWVVGPSLQRNVYGPTLPITEVTVIEPLLPPLHHTLVEVVLTAIPAPVWRLILLQPDRKR